MTEEDFEREELNEAAEDPNAVIDVKELAQRRQVDTNISGTAPAPLGHEYATNKADDCLQAIYKGLGTLACGAAAQATC